MGRSNNRRGRMKDIFCDDREYPMGEKSAAPVTPKMLISALKRLKKKTLKGLFFNERDVTCEILRSCPQVEQDFQVLYFEVSDKLSCAAAAGIIGLKQDHTGYYAFNSRQKSNATDYRSELMFWLFYKRLLSKRLEDFKGLTEKQTKEKTNKNDITVTGKDKDPSHTGKLRWPPHLNFPLNFHSRRKLIDHRH